ncbi:putative polysaccharide biosynthesis protein [Tepidibacter formicigenes]|jgi:stage V sporulation protein B|uniref:Stage V sporulation protein B n=1 Tax=Tepidibacter formicigenes DSM 15518 TaxID=1123349 RepID=A0A1M6NT01_9FIRM|nr:polysaccharide biosynthesis protein [Tepidibacter formicigenes]SHJ98774.1 stage V sporulation protein B [Tepidibacter formicigenes DSM 15518]
MGKNSFLKGAFILGVAGIVVKILGAFFRIPLGNIIGSEGMGYYQSAYPIYVLLLTISSAGFPAAISKLVSEKIALKDFKGAHKVFKVSFIALIITGIVTFGVLFFGGGYIVNSIKNPKAYYSMIAISPALLFVPIMAAFRGYFQGRQEMTPTAVSQIIEQFFRVCLGLYLAFLLLPKGREYAAAGASFGASAGALIGSLFMIFMYLKNKKHINKELSQSINTKVESVKEIINKLLIIAVPITIGSAIMPIMNMIDAAIVMRRLQYAGFTYEKANSLYGQLTGMAATLINLPQVLTMALAMSLVPVISHSFAVGNMIKAKNDIKSGVKVALLIGLPASFGLASLSTPIMKMLYPKEPLSVGQILLFLSMGVIFLSLIQTLTGILQGMGKAYIPVINLLIGATFKVGISYSLIAVPSINVKGAAIGTISAYIIATILNFYYIKRNMNINFEFGDFVLKPLISVIIMSICVILTYKMLFVKFGNTIACIIAILIGGLVYFILLLITKSIKEEEILMMPKGEKICKILKKAKLLR